MPIWSSRALTIFLGFAAASPCFAQGMPNTTTMSCKAAAALVASHGAIVLATGRYTYDRYVSATGYCFDPTEDVTMPAWVRTADNPECFIGYYCIPRPSGNHQ